MRPPETAEGGPAAQQDRPTNNRDSTRAPSVEHPATLAESRQLLDDLDAVDGHERATGCAWCDGYTTGYRAGYGIGHTQGRREAAHAQHPAAQGDT